MYRHKNIYMRQERERVCVCVCVCDQLFSVRFGELVCAGECGQRGASLGEQLDGLLKRHPRHVYTYTYTYTHTHKEREREREREGVRLTFGFFR